MHAHEHPLEERLPTRRAALLFRWKALCFQARRFVLDAAGGLRRLPQQDHVEALPIAGRARSDLWHESAAPRERRLQLGKLQNLRRATRLLHGAAVPADTTFSFWKQVGRATVRRGFAEGRELREGCLIPTVGGGLCQLSGAIYQAALEAGLEIVERHAHTSRGVSTSARLGRDATIFWNYVDLRLRAPFPWQLEVHLTRDRLEVVIRAELPVSGRSAPSEEDHLSIPAPSPNSCASCGLNDCFRHVEAAVTLPESTAWLVDDVWPELARYTREHGGHAALLLSPLNGRRWRKPAYAWPREPFARSRTITWLALRRAWEARSLRAQGAARQRALLAWDERLARAYQRHLKAEHTHLVIAQSLLPFLWRDGALGGRTFEVLMQRLPMRDLHEALDHAAELHPDFRTCADFRAPAWLERAESEALAAARCWITPHTGVARLAGERAVLLPWEPAREPEARSRRAESRRIVFPTSTLCRKGAVELRAAARRLSLEVSCLGGLLEGADFWTGVSLVEPGSDWLQGAACVVLPAFVEHRPRRLLQALAAGVPVICTAACGLPTHPLVFEVPPGDVDALTAALESVFAGPNSLT